MIPIKKTGIKSEATGTWDKCVFCNHETDMQEVETKIAVCRSCSDKYLITDLKDIIKQPVYL